LGERQHSEGLSRARLPGKEIQRGRKYFLRFGGAGIRLTVGGAGARMWWRIRAAVV